MASRDFRFFKCDCGHTPRFGASKCGNCYYPTRLLNRTSTYKLMLATPPLLGLALLALS